MLMTRILFLTFTVLMVGLNGLALWVWSGKVSPAAPSVGTALIVNALAWPIVLIVAYRIGQITGVENFNHPRARKTHAKPEPHA